MKKINESEPKIRPTVYFPEDEHEDIKIFCIKNKITMQDFLRHSALYCMKKKIIPDNQYGLFTR